MSTRAPEVFIIANPAAARTRRVWPAIQQALTQEGVSFQVCETRLRGDAEARTRSALNQGYKTIAVVGGDGTLSEVARGFFDSSPPVGDRGTFPQPLNRDSAVALLPAGTGDDFARGLVGSRAPLDGWVRKLIAHYHGGQDRRTQRQVDLICASVNNGAKTFICINAATLGIGADVAARVASQGRTVRLLRGEARFSIAALSALLIWRNRWIRITVDGNESSECSTNLIVVSNGPYVGGGMNFVPSATPDDGHLKLIATCGVSRVEAMREFARIQMVGHLNSPRILMKTGKSLSIEGATSEDQLAVEADGDTRGETPARFAIMPAALNIVW